MTEIDRPLTTEAIIATAPKYTFGKPLVSNNFRTIIVEAILHHVLEPDWRWCWQDWGPWDFEHTDGTRLEVKQSAAKQS